MKISFAGWPWSRTGIFLRSGRRREAKCFPDYDSHHGEGRCIWQDTTNSISHLLSGSGNFMILFSGYFGNKTQSSDREHGDLKAEGHGPRDPGLRLLKILLVGCFHGFTVFVVSIAFTRAGRLP